MSGFAPPAKRPTSAWPRHSSPDATGARLPGSSSPGEGTRSTGEAPPAAAFELAALPVSSPQAGGAADPMEAEADRVAELALQHQPFAASAVTPRIQRARADPAESAETDRGGGLIVDDQTRTLTTGQMGKSEFLAQLRLAVCAAADDALRRAGRDTRGCPYIERWLGRYAGQPAGHLERAIRKFVPLAAGVSAARDYIPVVSARVAQGVNRWVDTGRMPDDVPDELRAEMAGGGLAGALAGAASSLVGAIGGAVSSIGKLFFKEDAGGARTGVDRQALSPQLGSGRPLEGSARARMESAFGQSLSHVRVHDDGRAAALSRDMNARAFTLGPHVAFADGGYRPGTPVGDALLAHELAHVVQQGGGRATPADTAREAHPDQAIEADADRAAEGAVVSLYAPDHKPRARGPRLRGGLRLSRCASPGAKTPQAAAAPPAMYDTTKNAIIAMPRSTTLDSIEDNLDQEKTEGLITSWKAVGDDLDSEQRLYILYAIWQVSHTKYWDREMDLVTEVGRGKRGAITIRIDAGGNAVGSLVSPREPVVAATYATVEQAITGLTARYKLAEVKGEYGKVWSPADLNKVAAAWSRLSATEAAALKGFTLIRTDDTLHTPDGKPAAGLTITGDTLADDQRSSARLREMRFADRAFVADSISFIGDTGNAAPASAETIFHESGHAQEVQTSADAESAYMEAQVASKLGGQRVDQQSTTASNSGNAARYDWNRLPAAKRTASKGFADAFRAAFRAIEAFRVADDVTAMAAAQAPARDAVKARDAAKSALPADSPALGLYASALVDQDAYLAAVEAFFASRQAEATALASRTAARDPTGTRSARLQRFVDFVSPGGVDRIKPFTPYAKANWPANPEEFYAEAFSLWHADPKFVEGAAPDLKKWFDDGEHLK